MKRLEIVNTKQIKGGQTLTTQEVLEIRDLYNGEHHLVIRKISSTNGDVINDYTWSWSDKESWEDQIEDLNQKIVRYAETRQADEDEDPIGDIITLVDIEDIANPESRLQELSDKYPSRLKWYTEHYGKSVKTDKNGTLHFVDTKCRRCGGQGGYEGWIYTGYTCYRCDGSGIDPKPEIVKLYRPEYEVKLEEKRKKAEEKRIEEAKLNYDKVFKESLAKWGFNENMESWFFIGNTFEIKEQLKELGAKYDYVLGWHIDHQVEGFETFKMQLNKEDFNCSFEGKIYEVILSSQRIDKAKSEAIRTLHPERFKSEHQGTINGRLKGLKLTIIKKSKFKGTSHSYYDDGVKYFYVMKDESGNIFTWTTSSPMGIRIPDTDKNAEEGWTKWVSAQEGDKIILDGTVKEHSEYKGDKQTVLTRCKLNSVE